MVMQENLAAKQQLTQWRKYTILVTTFAPQRKEQAKKIGRQFKPKKNKLGRNLTIRQIQQQQVNQELKAYHKTAIVKTTGVSERPKVARSRQSCQGICLQIETEIITVNKSIATST